MAKPVKTGPSMMGGGGGPMFDVGGNPPIMDFFDFNNPGRFKIQGGPGGQNMGIVDMWRGGFGPGAGGPGAGGGAPPALQGRPGGQGAPLPGFGGAGGPPGAALPMMMAMMGRGQGGPKYGPQAYGPGRQRGGLLG